MKTPPLLTTTAVTGQLDLSLDLVRDFIDHSHEGKSNTVELFDALVLFSPDRARIGEQFLSAEKHYRGKTITVRVAPAMIEKPDGKAIPILPGRRENLVEKAIRKIASEDHESLSLIRDTQGQTDAGVYFTMYRLRKVLREQGHDFKLSQLAEALEVLVGTRMTITGELADDVLKQSGSGFLREYTTKTPKRGDPDGKRNFVYVKFHSFVTRSLIQKTFRRIDFGKLMRTKSELARWLYSRMSHNYIQAAAEDVVTFKLEGRKGYHILLSTIFREYALTCADFREGVRIVRKALASMRAENILTGTGYSGGAYQGFEEEVRYAEKKGRGRPAISEVLWTLFPSQEVIDDIIEANKAKISMNSVPKRTGSNW